MIGRALKFILVASAVVLSGSIPAALAQRCTPAVRCASWCHSRPVAPPICSRDCWRRNSPSRWGRQFVPQTTRSALAAPSVQWKLHAPPPMGSTRRRACPARMASTWRSTRSRGYDAIKDFAPISPVSLSMGRSSSTRTASSHGRTNRPSCTRSITDPCRAVVHPDFLAILAPRSSRSSAPALATTRAAGDRPSAATGMARKLGIGRFPRDDS